MGILSSSSSYTRFRLSGEMPEAYEALFRLQIGRNAFDHSEGASDKERIRGWVDPARPFDDSLDMDSVFVGDYIVLSMRVDKRTVPPRLLKHHAMQEEARARAESGRERLSRRERLELKELVKSRLLLRALPAINTYDMVWDIHKETIYFSSTAEKICDEFSGLFEETFGIPLARRYTYDIFAEMFGGDSSALERIAPALLA